jgi:hypothetical protein
MRTDLTLRGALLPLLLCVLTVTGCSTPLPPPQPVRPVQVPPPPAELMEPPASGSWSESAQQLYRRWLKLLTPLTPV